jgi:hypothetical protein
MEQVDQLLVVAEIHGKPISLLSDHAVYLLRTISKAGVAVLVGRVVHKPATVE